MQNIDNLNSDTQNGSQQNTVYFSTETEYNIDFFEEMLHCYLRKTNVIFTLWSVLGLVICAVAFIYGISIITEAVVVAAIIIFILSVLLSIRLKNTPKLQYNQLLMQRGKYGIINCVSFSDKITVIRQGSEAVSYQYAQVEFISETKNYYILTLNYNVLIAVDKSKLKVHCDDDFLKFLFSKCYCLKKSKLLKRKNEHKYFKFIRIIVGVITAAIIVLALYNITPDNWRDRTHTSSQTSPVTSELSYQNQDYE